MHLSSSALIGRDRASEWPLRPPAAKGHRPPSQGTAPPLTKTHLFSAPRQKATPWVCCLRTSISARVRDSFHNGKELLSVFRPKLHFPPEIGPPSNKSRGSPFCSQDQRSFPCPADCHLLPGPRRFFFCNYRWTCWANISLDSLKACACGVIKGFSIGSNWGSLYPRNFSYGESPSPRGFSVETVSNPLASKTAIVTGSLQLLLLHGIQRRQFHRN